MLNLFDPGFVSQMEPAHLARRPMPAAAGGFGGGPAIPSQAPSLLPGGGLGTPLDLLSPGGGGLGVGAPPPMMEPGFAGPPVSVEPRRSFGQRLTDGIQDMQGTLIAAGGQLLAHRHDARNAPFSADALLAGQKMDEKRRDKRKEDAEERRKRQATIDLAVKYGLAPNAKAAGYLVDAAPDVVLKGLERALLPEQVKPTADIQNYRFYASEELKAGRKPLSFGEWGNDDRNYEVDRRVDLLVESGLPEPIAKGLAAGRYTTHRDPISGATSVIDKGSGATVFDGLNTGTSDIPGGAQPQGVGPGDGGGLLPSPQEQPGSLSGASQARPTVPATRQLAQSSMPENVDPAEATGLSGVVGGAVNQVADLFGQGLPFPEVDQASEALTTLNVTTRGLLQEGIPGRPSNFLLEQLGKLAVEPRSLFRGDARAHTRLKQTRDLIQNEIKRIEQDILAKPDQYRPQEVTAARLNASQLRDLARSYETVIGTMERRQGESRPPLESFDRRRRGM